MVIKTCVVQAKRYLVTCWCQVRSDTGFRILEVEVESCSGTVNPEYFVCTKFSYVGDL